MRIIWESFGINYVVCLCMWLTILRAVLLRMPSTTVKLVKLYFIIVVPEAVVALVV